MWSHRASVLAAMCLVAACSANSPTAPPTDGGNVTAPPVYVVMFTHIEEDLAFPMPRGNAIDSYVVYIGFDPVGAQEMDRRRPPARPARPRASADAPAGPAAGRRAPL